jgi:hypothetical protein
MMKSTILLSSMVILIGAGTALAQDAGGAVKLTENECQNLWSQADSAQTGSITSAQAQPFVTNFKAVDANGDSKISSGEFLSGCKNGLVQSSASTGNSSGTSGEKSAPSGSKAYPE